MTAIQRILQEKRRLIVPLVVAALANVIAYAVVVFPLGRQVAAAEQERTYTRDMLVRARQDFQSARATVTGKQQADLSLRQFYTDVLPPTASAAQRVTYLRLAQLARDANVRLERGANAIDHLKNSSLSRLSTSYTLTGEYRDVRAFIYSLETAPEFVVLENVSLSSDQQAQHGLSVQIDVATYFRSSDGS
ncbi:MAG TPA: GspMb/PilO family protein [Vicinamibacterales bacterium]|nr:GspMb/PilO family protein [Vicinamibacterales bacterium]